jgi:LEA14-like dessication related protein
MPPTRVVANSSIYQDLTITVEYSKISKALINAILMRKIQVEIKGEIKTKILFGLLEISTPFTSTYSIG